MTCRRIVLAAAVVALIASLSLALPATRAPILTRVAEALVGDESKTDPADVVVVATDAGDAGLLEAADLVRSGVSARVAVSVVADGQVEAELRRRGVPYPDLDGLYRAHLEALGVRTIVESLRVTGSTNEGAVLPGWCDKHGYRSVLIVTSWHHSRRLQRVLERSMDGHSVKVAIRMARISNFGPENWWQTREGQRTVILELQKLALDMAFHPLN